MIAADRGWAKPRLAIQIHATGDANLGEGVKNVTATYDVQVIAGEAVAGEITFSQDVSQGGPPPSGGGAQSGAQAPGKGPGGLGKAAEAHGSSGGSKAPEPQTQKSK